MNPIENTTVATISADALRQSARQRRPSCRPMRAGAWPISPRCSRCPSTTCCSVPSRSTATHFDVNTVQLSTLLSIKTGGCEEDCGYCSQSAHHDTGLKASKLMALDEVLQAAREAKASGATRFCMGAAWRSQERLWSR